VSTKKARSAGKSALKGILFAVAAGIVSTAWIAGASAQSFTEFPIPTSNAFPVSMTFGPDVNLWFTEEDAN
jgi:streptogramin lyase